MLLVTEETKNGQYNSRKQQPTSRVVFLVYFLLIEAQNKLDEGYIMWRWRTPWTGRQFIVEPHTVEVAQSVLGTDLQPTSVVFIAKSVKTFEKKCAQVPFAKKPHKVPQGCTLLFTMSKYVSSTTHIRAQEEYYPHTWVVVNCCSCSSCEYFLCCIKKSYL